MTLLVRYIPPEMSGRAFGWVSLVRLIPYAVIPCVFDLLAIRSAAFPSLLVIAAVVALVPILLLFLPTAAGTETDSTLPPPGWEGMLASLRSPAVAMLLLSSLLFFCGYATIFFFLQQFAGARGIGNASFFSPPRPW